ncbi:MAG: NUDIX hydrolase [Candidatus Acidiferrum sp.]
MSKAKSKGKAKILNSKIVFRGKVFGVRRDEVEEPGGVRATREVITHSGSVVVLPVFDDGRILMIRQYRHAARQYLWELVAGRIDRGETVKHAAARELKEETGYRAAKYHQFLNFFPSPGFLQERMHLLLAKGLKAGEAEPEADEKIISHAYSANELKTMIKRGELKDGKSIAGILFYLTFLK